MAETGQSELAFQLDRGAQNKAKVTPWVKYEKSFTFKYANRLVLIFPS